MSKIKIKGLQYFIIITEQKKKDKYLAILSDFDAHVVDAVYVHGSVSPNVMSSVFGLDVNQGKIMISCLIKTDKAKELIEVLYNKYNFDKPNTGIAFSIPVEGLSF